MTAPTWPERLEEVRDAIRHIRTVRESVRQSLAYAAPEARDLHEARLDEAINEALALCGVKS